MRQSIVMVFTCSILVFLNLLAQPTQAKDTYTYERLGQSIGGYLYDLYIRDAATLHCPVTTPVVDVKDENTVIRWALELYPPTDRKKAEQELRSSLFPIRMQAYDQARNVFIGFFYRSETEKKSICNELKRIIEQAETENLSGIMKYKYYNR